jgi:hypothetical protein
MKTAADPNNVPPIGGGSLQCTMAFEALDLRDVEVGIKVLRRSGYSPRAKDGFVALDANYLPCELDGISSSDEFLSRLRQAQISTAIVNMTGEIADVSVRLGASFHFAEKVVVLSVPEDMIWAYSADGSGAKPERVLAFFALCKAFCTELSPARLIVDTEGVNIKEVSIHSPKKVDLNYLSPDMLDDSHALSLFRWYVDTYLKRWDKAIKVPPPRP